MSEEKKDRAILRGIKSFEEIDAWLDELAQAGALVEAHIGVTGMGQPYDAFCYILTGGELFRLNSDGGVRPEYFYIRSELGHHAYFSRRHVMWMQQKVGEVPYLAIDWTVEWERAKLALEGKSVPIEPAIPSEEPSATVKPSNLFYEGANDGTEAATELTRWVKPRRRENPDLDGNG